MWPNISSAAHYRGAGGDYSCLQGHEQTFQGFTGSNFEKGVSPIFLNRVGRVSDDVGSNDMTFAGWEMCSFCLFVLFQLIT